MTVWAGFLAAQDLLLSRQPCRLSTDMDTFAVDYWPAHAVDMGNARLGQQTNNAPVDLVHWQVDGFLRPHYGDDWYNRIHILPNPIDLGVVLHEQQIPIEIWNAFFVPAVLDDVIPNNDSGLTLVGPIPPPTTFNPLESRFYTLSVSLTGAPNIAATYDFHFGDLFFILTVTGVRVVTFAFAPDWSDGLDQFWEWYTDVLKNYDGTEQRRGLRVYPRRGMSYKPWLRKGERRFFENFMRDVQARPVAVPIWSDPDRLTVAAITGDSILSIQSTDKKAFIAGGIAIILQSAIIKEIVVIESLTTNTLTLANPIQSGWPIDTLVYPLRIFRMNPSQSIDRLTAAFSMGQFEFIGDLPETFTSAETGILYRGEPVWLDLPNYRDSQNEQYDRKINVMDYDVGLIEVDDESGRELWIWQASYLFENRTKWWSFLEWAYARQGKFAGVWIASHAEDFKAVVNIGSTDTQIIVEYCGYTLHAQGLPGRRDIIVFTHDGNYYMRRITGSGELPALREQLTIDSQFGVNINLDDIAKISFLRYARLAEDRVTLHYHSTEVVEADVAFEGLLDSDV